MRPSPQASYHTGIQELGRVGKRALGPAAFLFEELHGLAYTKKAHSLCESQV